MTRRRLDASIAVAAAFAACTALPTPPADSARPLPGVEAGPAAPAHSAGGERAEVLVEQAANLYRNAQFGVAIARAQQAQQVLATLPSGRESDRTLGARAAFITGCSLAAFGADVQAVAAFSKVHALDPQFAPPQGWLSPRLEKLYVRARNR